MMYVPDIPAPAMCVTLAMNLGTECDSHAGSLVGTPVPLYSYSILACEKIELSVYGSHILSKEY